MPETREEIVELDDLVVRPGTYFNPQTEVVVIVDDSTTIDQEVFDLDAYEGTDWVRVSDEIPVDEDALGKTLEEFQTHYHPATSASVSETALEQTHDDEVDAEEQGPEPDPEPED